MNRIPNLPLAILSAERSEYPAEVNEWRTSALARQLEARGLRFSPVTGCYKGTRESSFVVTVPDGANGYAFSQVMSLARRYGQESVLYVDSEGRAELRYLSGAREPLGVFQPVSAAEALALDAYTETPDGRYYATRAASIS